MRLSSCARARNNFVEAQELLDTAGMPQSLGAIAALVEAERGLVLSRLARLRNLKLPTGEDERTSVYGRLKPAVESFQVAVNLDPKELRANYCLAAFSICEANHSAAAGYLERAAAAISEDPVHEPLLGSVLFHQGLELLLQLEPGYEGHALGCLLRGMEHGYRPTPELLRRAVEALEALGVDDAAARVLAEGWSCLADVQPVLASAELLLRKAQGVLLDRVLTMQHRLGHRDQARLIRAALTGALVAADQDLADSCLDRLDDLLDNSTEPAMLKDWIGALEDDQVLRDHLGQVESDLERARRLREIGEAEAAEAVLFPLVSRALNGGLRNWPTEDLLDELRDIEAPEVMEELEARHERQLARSAAAVRDDGVEPALPSPAHIVFVGGNETQRAYQNAVMAALAERYGDTLDVRWHYTGWSANWGERAERVESDYNWATAVVLMRFVRTNLGRRIRRTSGEHDLPWVPCSGHGRESIMRAIEHAAFLAR